MYRVEPRTGEKRDGAKAWNVPKKRRWEKLRLRNESDLRSIKAFKLARGQRANLSFALNPVPSRLAPASLHHYPSDIFDHARLYHSLTSPRFGFCILTTLSQFSRHKGSNAFLICRRPSQHVFSRRDDGRVGHRKGERGGKRGGGRLTWRIASTVASPSSWGR